MIRATFVTTLAILFAAACGKSGSTTGTGSGSGSVTGSGSGSGSGSVTGSGSGSVTGSGSGSDTGSGSGSAPLAPDRWKNDLDLLARELPAKHIDLFARLPEADFRATIAKLQTDAATLTDDQVRTRIAQLLVSLGDGHTRLVDPAPIAYPVRYYWFDDGLFVIGAPPDALWAVGGQVLAIGGVPVADALALAATATPHDNDSQLRGGVPEVLRTPRDLRGLGLAGDGPLEVRLQLATEERVLSLAPGLARPSAPRPTTTPLARTRPRDVYWQEYLPDRKAIFFQYNACRQATPPFADSVASLAQTLDAQPVERIVIDLRQNGGGDSEVFRPFRQLVADRPDLGRKLFVLVGRGTFSSAVLNALQLDDAGATLVGETLGGAPTHFGEVQTFALPDHAVTIQYSTKHFVHPRHPGRELAPHVAVPVRAADWFAGADPALETALTAKARPRPRDP